MVILFYDKKKNYLSNSYTKYQDWIKEYKIIEDGYGDLEFECSVDMSVDGYEETYANRVFGKSPFNIRYHILKDIDGGELNRVVQILFEKGESNYG